MRKLLIYVVVVFVAVIVTGCGLRHEVTDTVLPADIAGQPEDYSFVVMGDSRNNPEKFSEIVSLASNYRPDYVFHLGDLVHKSSEQLLKEAKGILDTVGSSVSKEVIVGNHDVEGGGGLPLFNRIMGYPEDYKGYTSFDRLNAHFIILNSFESGRRNVVAGDQLNWLKKDLSVNAGRPIFVFVHSPLKSAGTHSALQNAEDLHKLFTQHRVVAVFSAHEHLFYHEEQDGVHYVTTGGAGAPLYDAPQALAIYHFIAVKMFPRFSADVIDENGMVVKTIQ